MPTGTIRGYDHIMVAGYVVEGSGARRDFASSDVASGQGSMLYNGALADFTRYTGQGGSPRARNVRLAVSRTAIESSNLVSEATASEGVATVTRYDNALGGYLSDNATGEEMKFSDRVVAPASAELQEGDTVRYVRYASVRRGKWAKSVRPISPED